MSTFAAQGGHNNAVSERYTSLTKLHICVCIHNLRVSAYTSKLTNLLILPDFNRTKSGNLLCV